jgi:hypothetical protein
MSSRVISNYSELEVVGIILNLILPGESKVVAIED